MILHLVHIPWVDGTVTDLRAQNRQDRRQLYARSFAEFEAHARDELTRVLGPGGFDADRDIAAITVNRWGHGYSYEPIALFDPPAAEAGRENQCFTAGTDSFLVAGTDAVWEAYRRPCTYRQCAPCRESDRRIKPPQACTGPTCLSCMKVSILIAVFNEASTIGELLERVWAATHPCVESRNHHYRE